jgi:membrane associated rhomboid family serine protease
MNGKLSDFLSLQPAVIIDKLELWRIVTFPFSPSGFEGTILFFITFYIFAPRMETLFHKALYPIILFLVISLQGTISSLIFWRSSLYIEGMEGLSFFVLTLFLFFNANKKVILWQFPPVSAFTFVFFIAIGWAVTTSLHAMVSGYEILVKGAANAIFGLTGGLIIFLQLRLSRNIKHKDNDFPLDIPKPEELSLALIRQNELREINNRRLPDDYFWDEDIPLTEDKLNEILDKISENGKESLLPEEIRFLEEYSKRL